jgi:hypothetical protein
MPGSGDQLSPLMPSAQQWADWLATVRIAAVAIDKREDELQRLAPYLGELVPVFVFQAESLETPALGSLRSSLVQ